MITIENNQIIRDGEPIGVIHDGIGYMKSKPAPRLVPQIREAAGNPDLKFEVGDAPTIKDSLTVEQPEEIGVTVEVEAEEEPAAPKPLSDSELLAEMQRRGLIPAPVIPQTAPPELIAVRTRQEIMDSLQAKAAKGQIQPAPECHPQMGDKTPEFVAWVKANTTEREFLAIYGNRLNRKGKLPSAADFEEGERRRIAQLNKLPTEVND